jgi:hypothetical protein
LGLGGWTVCWIGPGRFSRPAEALARASEIDDLAPGDSPCGSDPGNDFVLGEFPGLRTNGTNDFPHRVGADNAQPSPDVADLDQLLTLKAPQFGTHKAELSPDIRRGKFSWVGG